jgi:hypothetical protein
MLLPSSTSLTTSRSRLTRRGHLQMSLVQTPSHSPDAHAESLRQWISLQDRFEQYTLDLDRATSVLSPISQISLKRAE